MHSIVTSNWKTDGGTYGLRQVATGHRGFPPFTYRGLVEFLIVAEEVLDSLGVDPNAR